MELIYSAWSNAEEMAAELGEKGVTVRQWRNRGSIPPDKWAKIIDTAAARGIRLSVEDFGPTPPEVIAVERAIEAEKRAAA